MGHSKTPDELDDQEGVTLPLRRQYSDDAEAIGIAPTTIEFSTSRCRKREDGTVECKCPKCGAYFSEDEPHTEDMCELAQIMGE